MPKSDKENVIDLCISSDEDDAMPVKRVASQLTASIGHNTSGKTKVIQSKSYPSNPYQIKKRPRLVANFEKAAPHHTSKISSEQSPLFLFISGDGVDNATVTDDVATLLKDVPNVRSCVATDCETESFRMLHIQQRDKWSCGFRNLQMILSSIVPLLPKGHSYFQRQPDSREEGYCSIPSLLELQELMELSWAVGYDHQGAEHYNRKIVGSSKQIGAAEVSNLLSFCGIENAVVQFISCMESRALLGPFCLSYFSKLQRNHLHSCHGNGRTSKQSSQAFAQQLLSLSKSAQAVDETFCTCPVVPLYLQWEGHSVTVVGVEADGRDERNSGIKNILVFDPAAAGSMLKKSLQMQNTQPLRLPLSKLKGKDCQIIVTSLVPLSPTEQEQLKLRLRSVTAASDAVTSVRNRR